MTDLNNFEKCLFTKDSRGESCHPLEEAQKNFRALQEENELKMTARTFGIGFSLHLRHERAAASCPQIGHLEFLNRHNVMHQSLTGRDVDFDFDDMLCVEPEFSRSTNKVMDNFQKNFLVKK